MEPSRKRRELSLGATLQISYSPWGTACKSRSGVGASKFGLKFTMMIRETIEKVLKVDISTEGQMYELAATQF